MSDKEFGSDFHYIDNFFLEGSLNTDILSNKIFIADGRLCICALIKQYGWKRIWIPEYFCYDVIDAIQKAGIVVMTYKDYPGNQDNFIVHNLPYEDGDVLFRVNYFGMRDWRDESSIPIPVIEDHTHDLFGNWASKSNADWCIASLRKSYPIPEGGLLWSPKGNKLAIDIESNNDNEAMAVERWSAMEMKARYLEGEAVSKATFRDKFLQTEAIIGQMREIVSIDSRSLEFLNHINHTSWNNAKQSNLALLKKLVDIESIEPESEGCNLFSFVILLKDKCERDSLRSRLTADSVYTAVLWNIPDTASCEVQEFSERMLSIHCDGRYNENDIKELARRINRAL